MKKKIAIIFLTAMAAVIALAACLGLTACGDGITIEQIRDVGTYSGYEVWFVRVDQENVDVVETVTELVIDDVYIFSLPNPKYDYLVYTSKTDYLYLRKAYENGLITHDDLEAIAAAEAQYDFSRSEQNDVYPE